MMRLLRKAILNPRLAFKIATMRFMSAIDRPEFYGEKKNRSAADSGHYVKVVRKAAANYKTFRKFKRHPYYMGILEHVTKSQGEEYLGFVREESPAFMSKLEEFRENDLIGSPLKYSFGEAGVFSPTTLRYMKVASDLRNYFGDLTGFKIAEIGCGYGGQLLILDKIWKLGSHTMFDMDPVLGLISRYLESHLLRTSYHPTTINRFDGKSDFDLVISNYAFSELPADLERIYIEKVIGKAKRGYLTMNSGRGGVYQDGKLMLEELRQLLPPFEIIEERPRSAS
ncbi:MAG: putative sugar O-methyltransferase [Bdellovibrionales bacterium]